MNEQTWIDPKVDRSQWPAGDWDGEPDKVQWTDEATGLVCLAKRNRHAGNWCGYVGVSPEHPWHGKGYSDLPDYGPDVHGGLTYADACQEGTAPLGICHIPEPGTPEHLWWFGFDCHHSGDQTPLDHVRARGGGIWQLCWDDHYQTLTYVKSECAKLAAQIAAATPSTPQSEGQ